MGGRSAGKSVVGAVDLIRRAIRGRPNQLHMVASPTYTVLSDTTYRTFTRIARAMGLLASARLAPPSVRLINGAEIIFRSADNPDKLRGPSLSGVWLDEASIMHKDAYDICIACLREDGFQGWLSATFTPKGMGHWTYDVFAKGMPDTQLFRARTQDNPYNPPGFAATVERQYGAGSLLAAQELEGLFVSMEGAEWPADYFTDRIWFRDWPGDLIARVQSIDPSKSKDGKTGDYAAHVVLGIDPRGCLWADAVQERADVSAIVATGMGLFEYWQPSAWVVETNQFLALFAVLFADAGRRLGVPLPLYGVCNTEPKPVRIRRVGPYLARGELRVRDTPGGRLLVQQLRDFPMGEHDDGPDALEMAIRMLRSVLGGKRQGPGQPELIRG